MDKDNGQKTRSQAGSPVLNVTPEMMAQMLLSDDKVRIQIMLDIILLLLVEAKISTKEEVKNRFDTTLETLKSELMKAFEKQKQVDKDQKEQMLQNILVNTTPKGSA